MFFPPSAQSESSPPPTDATWSKQPGSWAGRRPWRFAAAVAMTSFAVFAVLPVWTAWYFSSWEGLGVLAPFWTMLASVPRASEHVRARELVLVFYGPELIKLAVVLGVGFGAGRWLAGRFSARAEPGAAPDRGDV